MLRKNKLMSSLVFLIFMFTGVFQNLIINVAAESNNLEVNIGENQSVSESVYGSVYATPSQVTLTHGKDEIRFPEGAQITDSLVHPDKPILYAVDSYNKKVYSVNIMTKDILEIQLSLKPERLTFYNNELYITLLKGSHNSYTYDKDQQGAIAIVDADTLNIKEQFNIGLDPFDITVGPNGIIYISSGSGQWTKLASYSRISKEQISSTTIREKSFIEYHPKYDKIYTTNSIYSVTNSNIVEVSYSGVDSKFKISPDGKYIFASDGNVYSSSVLKEYDMTPHAKLNNTYNDIAFNLEKNIVYLGTDDNKIILYNYDTLNQIGNIETHGNTAFLFSKNNKIFSVSKDSNLKYYIEIIDPEIYSPIPTPTNLSLESPIPETAILLPNNLVVSDSVIHPEKPIIYFSDPINLKIYALNYKTGYMADLKLTYAPEKIEFENNNIYVSTMKDHKATNIEIFDADYLSFKGKISSEEKILDFKVDKNGNIYLVTEYYFKSFSGQTLQELDSLNILNSGHLQINPINNLIYLSSDVVYRNNMYVFKYDTTGHIIESFNGFSNYEQINGGRFYSVSANGKYVFDRSGDIYNYKNVGDKYLSMYLRLSESYTDISFDKNSSLFYTTKGDKQINVFSCTNFQKVGIIPSYGNIVSLFNNNGEMIVLSQNSGKKYLIETLNPEFEATQGPIPTPIISAVLPTATSIPISTVSNGYKWSKAYKMPFGHEMLDIAYGNGVYVAVCQSGYIVRSTDSINWELIKLFTDENIGEIYWINDNFVALGWSGTVLISGDGINWRKTNKTYDNILDIAGNGDVFVGVSREYLVFVSSDGVNWENHFTGSNLTNYLRPVIIWDGNRFLVVCQYSYSSTDGINWTELGYACPDIGSHDWLNDIAFNGSKYITVGDLGQIVSSSDGVTWEANYTNFDYLAGVAYNDKHFICVGSDGILISENGQNWDKIQTEEIQYLNDVIWDGQQFLLVGDGVIFRGEKLNDSINISGNISLELNSDISNIDLSQFKVEIEGTSLSALTDKNGYFEINNVSINSEGYNLVVSKPGYSTKQVEIGYVITDLNLEKISVRPMIGDLNYSGNIDSIDFAIMRKYLLGIDEIDSESYILRADVNGDKSVNAVDFALIRKYLLGFVSSF